MEIDTIFYKAKDGRIFTDPLECEEYEKTIDIVKGSAAHVIQILGELRPETYVHGIVYLVTPDGKKYTRMCATVCCDRRLEPFVNVADLSIEQRYVTNTVADVLMFLKQFDKDSKVTYLLTYDDDIKFSSPGIVFFRNDEIWDKKKEK